VPCGRSADLLNFSGKHSHRRNHLRGEEREQGRSWLSLQH
jgi:hypothetical protein